MRPVPKKLVALLMAGAMIAAACGGDDAARSVEPASSPSTIAEPSAAGPDDTDSAADDAMDDEAMDDEAMDEEAMDDEAMDEEAMDEVVPMTDDGASALRAGLTGLLQEHLYLASIAIETAIDAGGDLTGPDVVAAVATLDENSVALAGARLPVRRMVRHSSGCGVSTLVSLSSTRLVARQVTMPGPTMP